MRRMKRSAKVHTWHAGSKMVDCHIVETIDYAVHSILRLKWWLERLRSRLKWWLRSSIDSPLGQFIYEREIWSVKVKRDR